MVNYFKSHLLRQGSKLILVYLPEHAYYHPPDRERWRSLFEELPLSGALFYDLVGEMNQTYSDVESRRFFDPQAYLTLPLKLGPGRSRMLSRGGGRKMKKRFSMAITSRTTAVFGRSA